MPLNRFEAAAAGIRDAAVGHCAMFEKHFHDSVHKGDPAGRMGSILAGNSFECVLKKQADVPCQELGADCRISRANIHSPTLFGPGIDLCLQGSARQDFAMPRTETTDQGQSNGNETHGFAVTRRHREVIPYLLPRIMRLGLAVDGILFRFHVGTDLTGREKSCCKFLLVGT